MGASPDRPQSTESIAVLTVEKGTSRPPFHPTPIRPCKSLHSWCFYPSSRFQLRRDRTTVPRSIAPPSGSQEGAF
ncbi:hypothetical protein [Oxynema aestuarii]|uniref:Uncharacterized protein n=1 Tax=Oxynema aestuarii AP17 TaxID=2064643 RepID=A0A6H1U4L1_9CYAN|nr:hypothetical protein [Oxynema aestuarii]QIZ72559.1 hypothetical protein HCG48_19805 [Oxynema aestuarii AP17]